MVADTTYESLRDFVIIWQTSESLEEVARLSKIDSGAASNRASYLRGICVHLKKMPVAKRESSKKRRRNLTRQQVAELMDLADRLAKKC